jgi:hypothetical protein
MFRAREAYTPDESLLDQLTIELENRLIKGSIVKKQVVENANDVDQDTMALINQHIDPLDIKEHYLFDLKNDKNPLYVYTDDGKYFFNVSETELVLYKENIKNRHIEKKPISLNEIGSIGFKKIEKSKDMVIYSKKNTRLLTCIIGKEGSCRLKKLLVENKMGNLIAPEISAINSDKSWGSKAKKFFGKKTYKYDKNDKDDFLNQDSDDEPSERKPKKDNIIYIRK